MISPPTDSEPNTRIQIRLETSWTKAVERTSWSRKFLTELETRTQISTSF